MWSAPVWAADPEENPYPTVVANFYFGGTFGTGLGWDISWDKPVGERKGYMPWFTPSLWESMNHYPQHQNMAENRYGIKTYHRYIQGVAAWQSDAYGDRPHCYGNPRGWEEVHSRTQSGGAQYYWIKLLEDLAARENAGEIDPGYTIIVNIAGQSRGGMSAIRFAGEISAIDQEDPSDSVTFDRIGWINVIATDPVWDENAGPGNDDPCWDLPGNIDYTRYHHYILGEKVKNYIGLYAEDERSTDFWPVVPHLTLDPSSVPYTNQALLVVPGSHQNLVGNYQADGHRPKHWLKGFDSESGVGPLKWDGYKTNSNAYSPWKSLQYAVTHLVLRLYNTFDFGFTEFDSDGDESPNYLKWAEDAIDHTDEYASWIALMDDARGASRHRVRSISFLPKGLRGKLMVWNGSACVEKLSWNETKAKWFYSKPRCGAVADGLPNDADNSYGAGLNTGPEVFDGVGATITPQASSEDMWALVEPILDSVPPFYTITPLGSTNGSISPSIPETVAFNDDSPEFSFWPATNHYLTGIEVDGVYQERTSGAPFIFSKVRGNHTIEGVFEPLDDWEITATALEGGIIDPSGIVPIEATNPAQDKTFYIMGDYPNFIDEVWVDGSPSGPLNVRFRSHTFHGIIADHTIEASFIRAWNFQVGVSPPSAGVVVAAPAAASPPSQGIHCGAGNFLCNDAIYPGDFIDLAPTAEQGFVFTGWSNCDQQPAPGHPDPDSCRKNLGASPPAVSGNRTHVVANFVRTLGGAADRDGDGIPNAVEIAAPNGGDGNYDGVADADQVWVASFVSPATGRYCTVALRTAETGEAHTLMRVVVKTEDAVADDPIHVYPLGVVTFVAVDGWPTPVQVRFIAHGLADPSRFGYLYRKFSTTTFSWETVPAKITSHSVTDGVSYTAFEFLYHTNETGDGDSYHGDELHAVGGPALADSDGDRLADDAEAHYLGTNPFSEDSDGDGLSDEEELILGTDPTNEDSNGDGVKDGEQINGGGDPTDLDPDDDEMPSLWETYYGLNPFVNDALEDPDGDGLPNIQEFKRGQDPFINNLDDDEDGMPTGWEDGYGLDPEVDDSEGDLDGDGLTNLQEFLNGSDPTDPTDPVPVELIRFSVE